MARYNYTQTSFQSGKLSKTMAGRIDSQEYANGAEEITNFCILPQGGLVRAPRTNVFGGASHTGLYQQRAFAYSATDVALISIRSSLSGGTLVITAVKADKTSYTITGSFPSISIKAGGFHFAQIGDLVFITHTSGLMEPYVLARTSSTTMVLQPYVTYSSTSTTASRNYLRLPFTVPNVTDTTFTINPGTTLTASVATFSNASIGNIYRIAVGATEGIYQITGYTSSTIVTVALRAGAAVGTSATLNYRRHPWLADGVKAYPTTCCIHESRLVFGYGNWFSGSMRGNLFHMMEVPLIQDTTTDVSGLNFFGEIKDSFPYSYQQSGEQLNRIQWVSGAHNCLTVGTVGGTTSYSGSQDIGGISPLGLVQIDSTGYGCSNVQPTLFGNNLGYIGIDQKSIFVRTRANNGFVTRDILAINRDIIAEEAVSKEYALILEIAFQSSSNTLWINYGPDAEVDLRFDLVIKGRLAGIVLSSNGDLVGCVDKKIGQFIEETILGLCSVPNFTAVGKDEIFFWYVVNKEIALYRYVIRCYFNTPDFDRLGIIGDFYDVVAQSPASAVLTTSNSVALEACKGYTMSYYDSDTGITYDNLSVTDLGISGAQLILPATTENGILYRPMRSRLLTMPIEQGGSVGTSQGEIHRADQATLQMLQSRDYKVGIVDEEGTDQSDDNQNVSAAYTGKIQVNLSQNSTLDQRIFVETNSVYPCNILNVTIRGVSNGR